MNFLKNTLFILFAFTLSLEVQAQIDTKFGFRAGMTIARMQTNNFELDANNNSLEHFNTAGKISVGATVSVAFNEYLGATTELLFSQKGSRYRLEGENSYLTLPSLNRTFQGHKKIISINITNNYVEIPVLFYVQPIKKRLQIDFGPSISFLASSKALGILKYGIIDEENPDPKDFLEISLNYKYYKDAAGAVASDELGESQLDQTTIQYPATLGAYYFFDKKKGAAFNFLDIGLNLGASFYFTEGLRVGGRFYYGLTDVTNNYYDVSQMSLNEDRNFIPRKDLDRNIGIQLFIGIQF